MYIFYKEILFSKSENIFKLIEVKFYLRNNFYK